MTDFLRYCGRLSALVKGGGLTRAELAARLGVKPATLKSWIVGRRSPTVRRLLELLTILGVDPRALFEPGDEEPQVTTCPACSQRFLRPVGYKIHVQLKARDCPRHGELLPRRDGVVAQRGA